MNIIDFLVALAAVGILTGIIFYGLAKRKQERVQVGRSCQSGCGGCKGGCGHH